MPDPELPPRPQRAPDPASPPAEVLVPADPADVASALAYALRFDERGRPRRGSAWDIAVAALAEQLATHLARANLVVMRRPPRPPHGAS